MNLLKVCNITEEGRFGGPARRITQVAQGLRIHGVDTKVVLPFWDSARFVDYLENHAVEYECLHLSRLTSSPLGFARYILFFIPELLYLIYFFYRNKFDIIHINGSYQFKSAIAACLAGGRVVWHLNDTKMYEVIRKLFHFIASHWISGLIFASEPVRKYYFADRRMSLPYEYIHAPVDLNKFNNRTNFDNSKLLSSMTILSVSGANTFKGLDLFLDIAKMLNLKYPGIRFRVAGSLLMAGAARYQSIMHNIKRLGLNSVVEFVDYCDDMPGFYSSGDLLLYTSYAEASPTAVWEAMASGLCVVTTNVGSVSDYFPDNNNAGFVVNSFVAQDFASLLERLIVKHEDLKGIGQRARVVAESRLSLQSCVNKTLSFYLRVSNYKNF